MVIRFEVTRMIGFQRELHGDQREPDEGLETRHLEKKELFETIAENYYIPPLSSKGVTRAYLLQVHGGNVFRVTKSELRHFEVDLTPSMQRRVTNISNSLVVRKLNILLRQTGKKTLGFNENEVPDQNWLCRVARFVDRTNVTELFDSPVKLEPPLSTNSSAISRIHHGRMAASKWFFRDPAVKANRKIWEIMREISDQYRSFVNHRVNLEIMEREIIELRQKKANLQQQLEDTLSRASLTYTAMENPQIKPEVVLAGGDKLTQAIRDLLTRNARM